MSLRVDDRKSRSRSKSSDGRRERSRSNVRAPSTGPQYYEHGGATPQYNAEVRQPGSQPAYATSPHEPVTMGNYADLPPSERPGYMQQAQAAAHYQYSATDRGPASPSSPGVGYAAPGGVQYAPTGQYNYTASAAQHVAPTRNPTTAGPGTVQYASQPVAITYSAKPVGVSQQPQVRHAVQNSQPVNQYQQASTPYQPQQQHQQAQQQHQQPQQQHQQQQQHQEPQQHQQPYYPTAIPQAPAPPSPQQHNYPPPPMGRHSPQPDHHQPDQHRSDHHRSTSAYDGRKIIEMTPQSAGGSYHGTPSPSGARPHSLSVSGGGSFHGPPSPGGARPHGLSVSGGGSFHGPPSPGGARPHSLSVSGGRPDGLSGRMDRLSVSGSRPDIQTIVPGGMPGGFPGDGRMPPPSPLLEAYHGVYQSISPMPHAMMMDDDLDHLPPLDSLSPRGSSSNIHGGGRHRAHSTSRRSPSPQRRPKHKDKLALAAYGGGPGGGGFDDRDRERERERDKKERRVKVYDATDDALALVGAMAGRTVDVDIIIDILPILSHDQMLELRTEYKRHCKVQGRGINIAKHIKMKTTGNFGKIAYVTALGRYESEGYWANYWYQSNSARRELLIEALMGRQNHEIREIKDAFKDKRYSDSLVKCMDKELKADKFRKAIMMALEGERQEENDVWPQEYRNRDTDTLYKAMKAREGGESAMLEVVVMRSDAHLRELLRTYERKYQGNFARDALQKSNNLVGEVVAHILNGVINRPARDSMLLHHALMDLIEPPSAGGPRGSGKLSAKEASTSKHERQQRHELVISRLVRLHWDRLHLIRVKTEYEEKYGRVLEEDIEEATKGDFREFCIALCQTGR